MNSDNNFHAGLPRGWRPAENFKARGLKIVTGIPRGKVLSYRQVAALAGSPGACRAVGNIMKANRDSKIPCHRVIRSDGIPGGYNGGRERKLRLLKAEGAL